MIQQDSALYQSRTCVWLATLERLCIVALLAGCSAQAPNWYVDNTATGANDGTSWNNAWNSSVSIVCSRVAAGDTLYVCGGATEWKQGNEND
jgi:hypothetical protein